MSASGVVSAKGGFGLAVVHFAQGARRLASGCIAIPHASTIGTAARGGAVGLLTSHLACEAIPLTVAICSAFGVAASSTLLGADGVGRVPQALGRARCGGGKAGTPWCTSIVDGPSANGVGCAARQIGKSGAGGVAGNACRVVCAASVNACGGIGVAVLAGHLAVATLDIPSTLIVRLASARCSVGLAGILTHDVSRVPHTLGISGTSF